jgi:hypothetical protein
MKITIEPVTNGAILEVDLQEEDARPRRTVYEFDCDEMQLEGLLCMMREILEALGVLGSKHDRLRPAVVLTHGEDYECREKTCALCGRTAQAEA